MIKSYFFIKNCYYLMIYFISFIQIVYTSSTINSSKPVTTVNSTNPTTNISINDTSTFAIKTSNIIPETANSTKINNITTSSIATSSKPFVTGTTVRVKNLIEKNNSTNHNTTIPFLTNNSTYFNSTNITKKYSIILEAASKLLINFLVYTRKLN